ncbi:MAG: cytochrome c3 family protein, partial [Bdellovibrionales bacterium]|nr:cytochrome c3 family protein [Bdellovibrionales bacterium]
MRFKVIGLLALIFSAQSLLAQTVIVTPIADRQIAQAQIEGSRGCQDCHSVTDELTMHKNPAVQLSCTDCHGGDAKIRASNLAPGSTGYETAMQAAHVQPQFPEIWKGSRNPENSYADLLKESWEFVRFMNPGDLRVARTTCGGCHAKIVHAVERSLMTTSAMLWGGAAYNNNILPFKNYILGESYNPDGSAREIHHAGALSAELAARGA